MFLSIAAQMMEIVLENKPLAMGLLVMNSMLLLARDKWINSTLVQTIIRHQEVLELTKLNKHQSRVPSPKLTPGRSNYQQRRSTPIKNKW